MEKFVKLKEVTKSDCHFLYALLHERDTIVKIYHKEMPSYKKHVRFVMSKPYSKLYIIYYERQKSGSIYLTRKNEIGIFIKKKMQGLGIGNKALQLMIEKNPRTRYLANTNPKNSKSIKFFTKKGFKLIQHTYALSGEELDSFKNEKN